MDLYGENKIDIENKATDSEGACLDNKGVWDRKNKVCRYDCLKWTDKEGCVPLK